MINIIAALLGSWRLTQVVTEDKVFDPIRKLFKNYPQVLLFLGCSKCVSVWCSTLSLLVYLYIPEVNYIFAFSFLYGYITLVTNLLTETVRYKTEKTLPHIVLRPNDGGIKMDYFNITENMAKNVIVRLSSEFTQQVVK